MSDKPHIEGVRVLRGPHWEDGDTDGGEGHLGTVQTLPSNGLVQVLWDIGTESTCRAGQDGKFDLRVFDTATVGVHHEGSTCAECKEEGITGILWRCNDCHGYELCSLCYADDKHDIRHQFLRIDFPGTEGKLMKKRKISVRIRAVGLFPGAKVSRGKDWRWKNQDGGRGSEGELTEVKDQPNSHNKRNLAKVRWPNGKANVYRLAFEGHVDITCTDEEAGGFYYRDHLPCLDSADFTTLRKKETPAEDKTVEKPDRNEHLSNHTASVEDTATSSTASTTLEEDSQSQAEAGEPPEEAQPSSLETRDSLSHPETLPCSEEEEKADASSGLPAHHSVEQTSVGPETVASSGPPAYHSVEPTSVGSDPVASSGPPAHHSVEQTSVGPDFVASSGTPAHHSVEPTSVGSDPVASSGPPAHHSVKQTSVGPDTVASSGPPAHHSESDPRCPSRTQSSRDDESSTGSKASDAATAETGYDGIPFYLGDDDSDDQTSSSSENQSEGIVRAIATASSAYSSQEQRGKPPARETCVSAQDWQKEDHHTECSKAEGRETLQREQSDILEVAQDNASGESDTDDEDAVIRPAIEATAEGTSSTTGRASWSMEAEPCSHEGEDSTCATSRHTAASDNVKKEALNNESFSILTDLGITCETTKAPKTEEREEGILSGHTSEDCTGAPYTARQLGTAASCSAPPDREDEEDMKAEDERGKEEDNDEDKEYTRKEPARTNARIWDDAPSTASDTKDDGAFGTRPEVTATDSTLKAEDAEATVLSRETDTHTTNDESATAAEGDKTSSAQTEVEGAEAAVAQGGDPGAMKDYAATSTPTQLGAAAATVTDDVRTKPFSVPASRKEEEISNEAGATGTKGDESAHGTGEYTIGDRAVVGVPVETLKELQQGFGGVTARMLKKIGQVGVVTRLKPPGTVGLRLGKVVFRFNPAALLKVHRYSTGDTVRIKDDLFNLRVWNERLGWRSSMDRTAGKVGQIARVDSDEDLTVSFGDRTYLFSPVCCDPAPGCAVDSLGGRGASGGDNSLAESLLGGSSLRDRLAGLAGATGGGGGGGTGGIGLGDLLGMSLLGGVGGQGGLPDLSGDLARLVEMNQQLSQLTGGGAGSLGGVIGGVIGGDEKTEEGRLQNAVIQGDVVKVKELCRANSSLINKLHNGLSPLMVASHQGKRKAVVALLDMGADVNFTGIKEQSALGIALEEKQEEIALLLIEHGANPCHTNSKQRTPLHQAVFNHLNEVAQILIHMGADISVQDKYGDTPLHDAIARHNVAMVDLLLQLENIQVKTVNKRGYSPLQLACKVENAEMVGLILAKDSSNVNQLKENDVAAIHICAQDDFLEGVRLLVTLGNADINMHTTRQGLTALHMACLTANVHMVETLLELGADANVQEHKGETPLHLAMGGNDGRDKSDSEKQEDVRKRLHVSRRLITSGAFVDAVNQKGRPPTTYGLTEVQIGVAQFLSENPELVRRKSSRSTTALSSRGSRSASIMTSLRDVTMPCMTCQGVCDVILMPCGHKNVCSKCVTTVRRCPLCQTPIARTEAVRDDKEKCTTKDTQLSIQDSTSSSDASGLPQSSTKNDGQTPADPSQTDTEQSAASGEDSSKVASVQGSESNDKKAATKSAWTEGPVSIDEAPAPRVAESRTTESAKPPKAQDSPDDSHAQIASDPDTEEKRPYANDSNKKVFASEIPLRPHTLTSTASEPPDTALQKDKEESSAKVSPVTVAQFADMATTKENHEQKEHSSHTAESQQFQHTPRASSEKQADRNTSWGGARPKHPQDTKTYFEPQPSNRDDNDDLELPDLPSMPAGGGFQDWVVMGPGGPMHLTGPDPSLVRGPASDKAPLNPWLLTNAQPGLETSVGATRGESGRGGRGGVDGGEAREREGQRVAEARNGSMSHSSVRGSGSEHASPFDTGMGQTWREPSVNVSKEGTSTTYPATSTDKKSTMHEAGVNVAGTAPAREKESNAKLPSSSGTVANNKPELVQQHIVHSASETVPSAYTEATSVKAGLTSGHKQTSSKNGSSPTDDKRPPQPERSVQTKPYSTTEAKLQLPPNPNPSTDHEKFSKKPDYSSTPNLAPVSITQSQAEDKKADTKKGPGTIKTYIQADNLAAIFQSIPRQGARGPPMAARKDNKMDELAKRATMSMNAEMLLGARGVSAKCGSKKADAESTKRLSGVPTDSQGQRSKPSSTEKIASTSFDRQSHEDKQKAHLPKPTHASGNKPETQESLREASRAAATSHTKAGVVSNCPKAIYSTYGKGKGSLKGASMDNAVAVQHGTIHDEDIDVGDKVVIRVDAEKLEEMQEDYGGFATGMLQCFGKTGTVTGRTPSGTVTVNFSSLTYRYNPCALLKVHLHKTGDTVRVRNDLDLVKLLNRRVGFHDRIVQTLGKVGRVTSADSEDVVTVSFGQNSFRFSPACCEPARGATPDTATASAGGMNINTDSGGSGSSDRQNFMKKLSKMVKEGASVSQAIGSRGSDSSPISRLFAAISENNRQLVKMFCEGDPSLVNRTHEGRLLTPLMYASWKGHQEVAQELLTMGADINGSVIAPGIHRTPLSAALEGKEEATAVFLLERGADPQSRFSHINSTPLHMAAYSNLVQVVQVLLQMGVDVNAKDDSGDTPLIDALLRKSRAVADILLDSENIDVSAVNHRGISALHAACLRSYPSAVQKILERDTSNVDKWMDGEYAPLHLAADNDCVENIRMLLLLGGADVNVAARSRQHDGNRALHMACVRGNYPCVEALLDFGADVNVVNKELDTPLHFALGGPVRRGEADEIFYQEERVRIACTLISNGAFVDAENSKGRSCMRYGSQEVQAAVQDFMDRNRQLVQKKGHSGDEDKPTIALRGVPLPCAVCKSKMSDVTLLPCGHKTACSTCAGAVTLCSLCQRRVDSTTTDDQKGALFEAI
ncbi:uncharacterized protein [Littorina saxatilis]|uniref:uncharacterized protein isoform X2 n=1 Tax=Littorina saxatilis TaxID=31220 RepID=UPI0038B576D0